MLNLLIGPITQLAGTWLEGTVETKKAKTLAKVATAKAEATIMEKKATGEIDWDLEAIKGAQNSWKDEWLVILFSVPLILAFMPGMEDVVSHGFQQLEQMPEWYQYFFPKNFVALRTPKLAATITPKLYWYHSGICSNC